MNDIYIGIGSNLDPASNIRKALPEIRQGFHVTESSRFYRNPACTPESDLREHPAFINGVIRVMTSLSPLEIKYRILRPMEQRAGRRRTGDRYAPRALDLDLLLYGKLQIDTPELQVPAPDLLVHPFWTVPMAELAPDRVIPGAHLPLGALAENMDLSGWTYDRTLTRTVRMELGLPEGDNPGLTPVRAGP
jgi:2-amino-4-hydroxy-6-hydroxymethyldihydropteridine diphosphokinase